MIERIAHLGDIHIPKSPTRHEEYREVFERLYKSLIKANVDRIVIVGDLFHDYIELQPEANILAGEFLNRLANIAPVRIIRGNHDIRKKALKRVDSIENVVTLINNPRVVYYNETDFFVDENVTWAVWKHGDKHNNPWKHKKKVSELDKSQTFIDLFHDPINGARSPQGYEFKKKTYYTLKDFQGKFSFFGDIHKKQIFDDKAGYCGSLIAQNFGEGDYEFHGCIVWDIKNSTYEEIPIHNDYSFKTIQITPYTDIEDLTLKIVDPTTYMKIRVVWKTLPSTYNEENKRIVTKYIKDNYNPISLSHKTEFVEDDEITIANDVDVENIADQSVQHNIFKDYFEKIGVSDDMATSIIELDDEISSRIEKEEFTNIEWNIIKLSARNFMSYETLEIDWRDMDGLYQITGLNTAGKTTLMKLITYILYNKTIETERVMKFGDMRYVNNRLNVDWCEGTLIMEVNGEYFGVKRTTKIERNKSGEIKGCPTQLEYFKLDDPDDELSHNRALTNLNDEQRNKTQKVLTRAIGSYDNFKRVVMTTSDTLNSILSDDKSVFIDSLLFDSGLDIFDLKLEALKEYIKELSLKQRVTCNVERSLEMIENFEKEIVEINTEVSKLENETLPEFENRIEKGESYIETLTKKLNKIDSDIYSLNIDETNKQISIYDENIRLCVEKESRIKESIAKLKSEYNSDRLTELLEIKDSHKQYEYDQKMRMNNIEREILHLENSIQRINGDVMLLKKEGSKKKEELLKLKESKNCPTCGQQLTKDHLDHFSNLMEDVKKEMYKIADEIKVKNEGIPELQAKIDKSKGEIDQIKSLIHEKSLEMENVLHEIGVLTNDKNDVEKRKELEAELGRIPLQKENQELLKLTLTQKIELYNKSLSQIEENKKIESTIQKAKEKLGDLKVERDFVKDKIYKLNTQRGQNTIKIKEINDLILSFKEQEKHDEILSIYKRCIHRDGIPTQLLKTYAIPKINRELTNLLQDVGFRVWLDEDELKLKLAYNTKLDAVIDAISASGKERTFASIALKFALNQINAKSKPTLFLLDEVMGKLTDDSVQEFINILNAIKQKMRKVLIVEHNHEISPDFLISVTKDDNDISSLTIE